MKYDELIHNCRMTYGFNCGHCVGDFCKSCDNNLFADAADAIEELQRQVPVWIPVKERLPELCVRVLACDVSGNVYESFVNVMGNWMYRKNGARVVYWMPLPAPKKEDK